MTIPPKAEVDRLLRSLEMESPRAIARERVANHRARKTAQATRLSQRDIDGDGRGEHRWVLVFGQTVRFHRRSLTARLLGWLRR